MRMFLWMAVPALMFGTSAIAAPSIADDRYCALIFEAEEDGKQERHVALFVLGPGESLETESVEIQEAAVCGSEIKQIYDDEVRSRSEAQQWLSRISRDTMQNSSRLLRDESRRVMRNLSVPGR